MRKPPDRETAARAEGTAASKSDLTKIDRNKDNRFRRRSQARVIAEVEWFKLTSRRALATEGWI
jgi:hypothetical protein